MQDNSQHGSGIHVSLRRYDYLSEAVTKSVDQGFYIYVSDCVFAEAVSTRLWVSSGCSCIGYFLSYTWTESFSLLSRSVTIRYTYATLLL